MANNVIPMEKLVEMRNQFDQRPYTDFMHKTSADSRFVWFDEHYPPPGYDYLAPENVRDYINSVIQGMPGTIEVQQIEYFYRSHPSPLIGGGTIVENDEYTCVRIWWKGRGW